MSGRNQGPGISKNSLSLLYCVTLGKQPLPHLTLHLCEMGVEITPHLVCREKSGEKVGIGSLGAGLSVTGSCYYRR